MSNILIYLLARGRVRSWSEAPRKTEMISLQLKHDVLWMMAEWTQPWLIWLRAAEGGQGDETADCTANTQQIDNSDVESDTLP